MNDNNLASCFTISNLMRAARECRRGVAWKRQTQQFFNHLLTNCHKLMIDILDGTYRPRETEPFTINERGKVRQVKPVTFRDRVAQRCFCDQVLIPAIESYVVDDCSAVLPGRGLTYAFDRVKGHIEDADASCWIASYDFKGFFQHIDHDVLIGMISGVVGDDLLVDFVAKTIANEGPGLDLGSHVSQLCATMYPTPIDRQVISMSSVVGYHRYMDDGIIVCRDKRSAVEALDMVREISDGVGLEVNERKTFYNRVTHPLVFCKMRFTKLEDGSVRMNVRKQQTRRSVRHAKSVMRLAERCDAVDVEPVRASFAGYVGRGDADLTWLVDKTFGGQI